MSNLLSQSEENRVNYTYRNRKESTNDEFRIITEIWESRPPCQLITTTALV
jgi:hypothetical protein